MVAIGSLGTVLVFLALCGVALMMAPVSIGSEVKAAAMLLPFLLASFYGVLVALALRGFRLPAVALAVSAWPLAAIPWFWLSNVLRDPWTAAGGPIFAIAFFGLYALSATYVAAHSLRTR